MVCIQNAGYFVHLLPWFAMSQYIIFDIFYVIKPYKIPPPSLYNTIFAMTDTKKDHSAKHVHMHKNPKRFGNDYICIFMSHV